MFEVGRRYTIVTQDHDGESSTVTTVLEYEHPLVKLDRVGNYEILNVTSPAFVRATPNDAASQESERKAHEEFMKSFEVKVRKPESD